MRILIVVIVGLLMSNCAQNTNDSNLDLDHLSIWVQHPNIAKNKLIDLGFTAIPDSLCQIHHGQGTSGRFIYFLNTYLEFIFINDSTEFYNNIANNKGLDFLERSNNVNSGYSPFGLGLRMNNYNKDEIPFEVIEYHQDWMNGGNSIYSAKNSKFNKNEPSVFVIYPEIEYDQFENMDSLKKIPEDYSIWRNFYKHKNGVEKVTRVEFYADLSSTIESKSFEAINEMEIIELLQGEDQIMEIYFDHNKQKKRIDLRPELPLILNW